MNRHGYGILPQGAEPCVWMSAGVLNYKLCDRDFDCESCPLDAAMRGEAREVGGDERVTAPRALEFPSDRSYSDGHLWVQPAADDGGVRRVGIDALAAALLGTCRRVRCTSAPRELGRGDVFCELELDVGCLSLGAPDGGRLEASNAALECDPAQVLSRPYDAGWLVELSVPEDTEPRRLSAPAARAQSELDLRRFRRSAALRMLVDRNLHPVLADGGVRLTDLRQMVGSVAYLELLRDLIH